MSKRFYEGDRGTLIVEHNGKLYPFVASMVKDMETYRASFADDDMKGYAEVTWERAKRRGQTFVEVEHDQDQANQA